jgi:hypothetical protein
MEHERGGFKVNFEITPSWVKEKAADPAWLTVGGRRRPSDATKPAGKLDNAPILPMNKSGCR